MDHDPRLVPIFGFMQVAAVNVAGGTWSSLTVADWSSLTVAGWAGITVAAWSDLLPKIGAI